MDGFVEEVLLPPAPLVVLCAPTPTPLLDLLSLALRSAAPPFGSPGAGGGAGAGGGSAHVQLRLEARQPAPQLYAPPRKRRSHAPDFYDSYAPRGVLQHGWLQSA